MDLKSLSLFMQTSLVYECKVCKLYFGNENQLLAHHKGSHSKRMKVSIDPELKLVEDPEYNLVYLEEETSLQHSVASCASASGTGKAGNECGESTVAKLQVKGRSSTTEESDENNGHSSGGRHSKRPSRSQIQISNDNQDSSSNSCQSNENEQYNDEPALKRAKTETEDSTTQIAGTINKNSQELGSIDKSTETATTQHYEHSQSMKNTIEQGHYGYLTETGFHPFSLENLKKFAVQVVALFKLDESHQNFPSFSASSQRMPIPVIQNDVTTSSMMTTFQHHEIPSGPKSGLDNMAEVHVRGQGQAPVDGVNATGISLDDPNKSCYKCGEQGHFAWGCTNPRNREIQPKRKRRGRAKRKEQAEMPAN